MDPYLADTNVLLRLVKRDHTKYPMVREAVRKLRDSRATFYCTMQNIAEMWNASTRPIDRNGFGLTPREADVEAREIESLFTVLMDNDLVYREWRRLIVIHEVRGAKVHDARLVAAMRIHGLRHLLTFNDADFRRYTDLILVTPSTVVSAEET